MTIKLKKKYQKKHNYKKLIESLPQKKIIFKNYKGIKIGMYNMQDMSKYLLNLKNKKITLYE